jgi:hypothetical protein
MRRESGTLLRKSAWQQDAFVNRVHLCAAAKGHGQIQFVVNDLKCFFHTWLAHGA